MLSAGWGTPALPPSGSQLGSGKQRNGLPFLEVVLWEDGNHLGQEILKLGLKPAKNQF